MSQPTTPTTAATATKLYSKKAQVYDCMVFFLFITASSILIVSVPVITRGVIFLQPETPQFNVSSSLTILNVSSNAIAANFNVKDNSSSRGAAVSLTTKLHARAKYGGWTWPVETDLIKATCGDDVKVDFASNVTALVLGSRFVSALVDVLLTDILVVFKFLEPFDA
ncbi:hypothetical protein OIU77_017243 [Salix suchowensis]|uniref:Late embryogenesis abundant protein LEA-2 subgroup domain-containing protein n=1 Tax=Salix suchowensis TaxID=1278906 RepID=A0ABQ8ZNP3_9ROSI|nr:hypothetical protein OIU77_017243 [Salix suchowensis]